MNFDEPVTFTAGPLSAVFYKGDVRYISVDGQELVRRIFFGVRDTAWGTAIVGIKSIDAQQRMNGFTVRYQALAEGATGRFAFNTVIQANATDDDVSLSMEVEGAALSDMATNRTGLSVLHPVAELAGKPCRIEMPDGKVADAVFPALISPNALFTRIQAISYRVGDLPLTVRLYGDLFETEDQRNWGDTSFKTYCRPLAEPRPYTLEAGRTVRHAVSVVVKKSASDSSVSPRVPHLRLLDRTTLLPAIGIRHSPGTPIASLVRTLAVDHYRVDVDASDEFPQPDLNAIAGTDVDIELGVHVRNEVELQDIAAKLSVTKCRLARVIVYQLGSPLPDPQLITAAKLAFPGIAVGVGTIGNFAEVNRNRSLATIGDAIAYAVNPQVHAMDDLSILENLVSLQDAVRTCRSFAPKSALAVGPITLHRVPDPFSAGSDGRLQPAEPDARQGAQLAAAWTLGVVKYLAESGVDATTLFETAGRSGLLAEDGSPWPVFHVLAAVTDFAGGEVIAVSDPAPLHVIGLALRKDRRLRLMIANTRWHTVRVEVDPIGSMTLSPYGVRIFDLPADGALER